MTPCQYTFKVSRSVGEISVTFVITQISSVYFYLEEY